MALKRKMIKNLGYGLQKDLIPLAPEPIIASAAPTTTDVAERGQVVVTDANTVHLYAGKLNGASVWKEVTGGGASTFTTIDASTSVTTPLIASTGAMTIYPTTTLTINPTSLTVNATLASSMTVTGAGEDLTLAAAGGSIDISSSEAVATAVSITSSAGASGITLTTGTLGLNVLAPFIQLGDCKIYVGAGDPAGALSTHIGDLYIRSDAVSAVTRMFIADAIGTWVNVSMSA